MSNPLKRARVDEESPGGSLESLDAERHPNLWFDDGSIVLKVQKIMFKVHRTLLASHSTIFADMFSIPQPPVGQDMIEGCAVVSVPDDAKHFEFVLKALYDPPSIERFMGLSSEHIILYHELEGILRLSTKYAIRVLRTRSVQYMKEVFPAALDTFDDTDATQRRSAFCQANLLSLAQVLQLCRECDAPESLPYIFYMMTKGFGDDMLLQINTLPKQLWRVCFSGREKLLEAQKGVYSYPWDPKPSQTCTGPDHCTQLGRELHRHYLSTKSDRHQHVLEEPFDGHTNYVDLVSLFRSSCKTTSRLARTTVWQELPEYFGLGTWEELHSSG